MIDGEYDGPEYDEGSDIDNWEDEQVFRDTQAEMREDEDEDEEDEHVMAREEDEDEAREEAGDRIEPPVGSWAATARVMAEICGDDGMDWDQWKDDMKEL